ncbi:MAG: oxidoreductase [Geminicoccaceae bacterium]
MLDRRDFLLAALATLTSGHAAATLPALPAPAGDVILTVTGDLAVSNGNGVARFDRALLDSLGHAELETVTPWTDGMQRFAGVPALRLVEALGSRASRLETRALNDYAVAIPRSDLESYPVLLATHRDGAPLPVRERGPIWVVYPWSQYPELDRRIYRQRSIWQLVAVNLAS